MSRPATPRSGRVLLVEDSRENIAYVTELLGEIGCALDTARDGREALNLFDPGKYALILMDCQMPVMDGFEASREIRSREAAAGADRAYIVALTANATEGVPERCRAHGMDETIIKPFEPDTLRALVESRLHA